MTNDVDQFWTLVEPEYYRARAFCRKLAGNRDDGDDLYQDVMVAAWQGFSDLEKRQAFRGWLYRIIVNTYKNRRRSPWWKKITSLTPNLETFFSVHDPRLHLETGRRLDKALQILSPEDRALITLFELQGWKISELASMMNLSEGNIRVRLHRIRKKMRQSVIRDLKRPTVKSVSKIIGVQKGYALSRSTEDAD